MTLSTIAQNKNNHGELLIENGRLVIIKNNSALRQLVQSRLLVFQGEYFLNVNLGLDYNQIHGSKTLPDQEDVIAVIEGLGYGLIVTDISIDLQTNRKLKIDFTAESEFGTIEGGI